MGRSSRQKRVSTRELGVIESVWGLTVGRKNYYRTIGGIRLSLNLVGDPGDLLVVKNALFGDNPPPPPARVYQPASSDNFTTARF